MTVDLAALKDELEAAGYNVACETYGLGIYEDRRRENDGGGRLHVAGTGICVLGKPNHVRASIQLFNYDLDDPVLDALDIIRRHIAPVSPVRAELTRGDFAFLTELREILKHHWFGDLENEFKTSIFVHILTRLTTPEPERAGEMS